jgi:hypothetical protein
MIDAEIAFIAVVVVAPFVKPRKMNSVLATCRTKADGAREND